MRKTVAISAMLLAGIHLTSFGQDDNLAVKNAITKLQTFTNTHLVERAYLHFDKPYYAAGDTIYFKAYVVTGDQHEPGKMSSLLNVDLIAPNDIIKKTIKLQINNGMAWGDFTLPDSLHQGNYRVRAYTQLMLADNGATIFNKIIPVGSATDNTVTSTTVKYPAEIWFFPEGGALVADIKSTVAFKATGANGFGQDVKGVIIDNTNKEVTKFESQHLGMGSVQFKPEAGKSYQAKVTFADGSQSTIDLSAVNEKGIVLAVNNTDPDKIALEIRCNNAYLAENQNKDIGLVIYSGNEISNVTTKLTANTITANFPKNAYSNQLLQFTLFSGLGEPLSERLVFVQNTAQLNLDINTDKSSYVSRGKTGVTITAKDKDNKPVAGHFSVAVIDENKVPVNEDTETTILTELLLSSNLQGFIEQPNYYFNKVTDKTRADLDLVMLTHGFRRFVWKELLSDSYKTSVYQPQKGLEIKGTLKTAAGTPVSNKNLVMLSTDAGLVLNQQTDLQGQFDFKDLAYTEGTRFVIKAGNTKGKNAPVVTVIADKPIPVAKLPGVFYDDGNVNSSMPAYLENVQKQIIAKQEFSGRSRVLKTVNIKSKKDDYRSSNLSGSGNADQVVRADQLRGYSTLTDALNGRLRGVDINNGVPSLKNGAVVNAGTVMTQPMLIVIDGTRVKGGNLDDYNLNDIETVEVLKSLTAGIYGVEGANGVIVLTTKQTNNITENTTAPGVLDFTPPGFYKAREFYAPKYLPEIPAKRADLRSTVYWLPELVTDKNGNAAFDYYNNDGKGSFRIVVEGIDDNGSLGRKVARYKVE